MTDQARRLAAIAMLIASCAAILATTPGEPTASIAVEGDVAVGPEEPAEILVRFGVAPSDQIDRGWIRFSTGLFWSSVRGDVTAVADGVTAVRGDQGFVLPVHVCRDGCDVQLRALLTWSGEPGDRLRGRWNAEIDVVYQSSVPAGEPVAATIVAGHGPPVGRNLWLLVGAVAAALTAAAWLALGARLAAARLVLAALSMFPPLWMISSILADFDRLIVDLELVLMLAVPAALVVGAAVGLVSTARGSPIALPAVGWAYVIGAAYLLWLGVDAFSTYRPHEVALLTFGVLVPGVAAVTAVPPAHASAPVRLRIGTSFVLASVLAEFAVTAAIAVLLLIAFAFSIARGQASGDPTTILLGLVPIAVAIAFVIGLRRWWSGTRLLLGFASGATLLVFVPLVLFVFGGQGFLVPSPEARVLVLVCLIVNLLGLIGLAAFPTPADGRPRASQPDDERHEEPGQRQQVGRVLYEPDVEGGGDRT